MTTAVVAAAGVWSVAQAPLVRAFTVWDVTDFGAVGDGTSTHKTINSQAIKDAVEEAEPGDEIFFPEGNYAVEGKFTFSKSLTFRGSTVGAGATIKNVNPPPTGNFITITENNISFIDLIFRDATAQISANYLTFAATTPISGGWVQGCTFITPNARSVVFTSHTNGTVDNNIISPAFEGIRLNGACAGMTITRNDVRNWKQRGIVATGNDSGAASNLTVDDNQVRLLDPNGGGTSRYPIQIIQGPSSPTMPSGIQVSNNALTGINTAWREGGTADQLQLVAVDFDVFGNTSVNGGEVGMTIAPNSHQGSVHDNICNTAETAGLALNGVWDVQVFNNNCRNNGQNRTGDRLDVGRAGIYVQNSNTPDINISGNTVGDNQTPKTQCYGIVLRCSSDVTVRTNTDAGNKLDFLHRQCP